MAKRARKHQRARQRPPVQTPDEKASSRKGKPDYEYFRSKAADSKEPGGKDKGNDSGKITGDDAAEVPLPPDPEKESAGSGDDTGSGDEASDDASEDVVSEADGADDVDEDDGEDAEDDVDASPAPKGDGDWDDEEEGYELPADHQQQSGGFMQTFMIFLFMMTILVIVDPEMRRSSGMAMGAVLEPLIGFDGNYPVYTLMCASMLMVGFSTILRHIMTDWMEQAKIQKVMSAYNKELREARTAGNQNRVKLLMESQGEIMQYQSKMMMMSMKAMVFTTIVAISIFTWLFTFFGEMETSERVISLPWAHRWSMMDQVYLFPNWVLIYSLISIPTGQLIIRILKMIEFRPRRSPR